MEKFKGRILVLDDEIGMCESLGLLLKHSGYDALVATSVKQGIDFLTRDFFDVVVSDLVFPDGNGLEILKFCRKYCPKTKVICMTGYASIDSAIEALRNGAFDYVTKPFDFDFLYHSIEQAMDHLAMEEEIDFAKQRYHALVEDLSEGYFVMEEGKIVYANPSMARLLLCDMEGLIGRPLFDFVDTASRPRLEEQLECLLAGKGTTFLEEINLKDVKGSRVPVEIKLSNTRGRGSSRAIVGICRHISEREVLWERLVKAEKLAMMGEMMAGIAHELNNKLTPILGYTEMLGEMTSGETKKRLETAHRAAMGAKSIVESLLLFSRQEKPERTYCDINELVRTAAELVSSSYSGSRIELRMNLAKDPPAILVDPHQIEQVFSNIIKNAYEVLSDHGLVSIQTRVREKDILVSVTDNGPGIPIDVQDKIFDPFFSTKDRHKGTGLGLSICHGIVKEHGGEIKVLSEGSGTTFSVSLPVAEPCDVVEDKHEVIRQKAVVKRVRRILLVDDEKDIVNLLSEILSDEFETEIATNGIEALEKLEKGNFDLIISDVKMPGLDGIGLYRKLEQKAPWYCCRIIYTTGVAFDRETHDFLKETKVPYLKKPYNVKEITELISNRLNECLKEGSDVPVR